jgi:hypothetical protein
MNHPSSLVRALGLGAFALAALSACQGEGEATPEAVGAVAQALCTATQQCPGGSQISCSSAGVACTANADANGLYVECDGARTYCGPVAPACTCGATKHESASAWGATCGSAYNKAMQYALAHSDCPDRICGNSFAVKECNPVSSNRDDGFEAEVVVVYTCKEPANCQ